MQLHAAIWLFVYNHMGLLDHADRAFYTAAWAICKWSQIKSKSWECWYASFIFEQKYVILILTYTSYY